MNVFKRFFLKVKKFFSKFTKQKNDDPASSQGAVPSNNDEPRSTLSPEPSHTDDPHVSQRTIPSHSHNQSSDKALSALIFSVGAAETLLDDLHAPLLDTAVGSLLLALKSIRVCSQYKHLYSYIM